VSQRPGEKAGIRSGDQLVAINQHEIKDASRQVGQMYRAGAWSKVTYSLVRGSIPVDMTVVLAPADHSSNNWLRVIALIYLGIGIYVLMRRWTAPAPPTSIFFAWSRSFSMRSITRGNSTLSTGQSIGETWWRGCCSPPLFLHFVLTFPERRDFVRRTTGYWAALYAPGLLLLGLHIVAIRLIQPSQNLSWTSTV